jgi:hypothetical protein
MVLLTRKKKKEPLLKKLTKLAKSAFSRKSRKERLKSLLLSLNVTKTTNLVN